MVEIKHRRGVQNPFRRGTARAGLPTHYGKQGSFRTHNGGHSPLKRLRNICVFMVVGGLALYTFLGSSSSESPTRVLDDFSKTANDGSSSEVDPYEQKQQQQQRQRGVLRSRSRDSKPDSSYKKRQPSDSVENKVDSNEGDKSHNNYDNLDHSHHHDENPNSHEEEEEEEGHGRGDGSKNGHVDSHSMDAAEHDKTHLEHAKQVAPDPMSADSEENKNKRGGAGNKAHHDTQQQDKESAEENMGMDSHEQQDKDSLGHGDKAHDEGHKNGDGGEETKDQQSHDTKHSEVVGDKEVKDGLDTTTTNNENESKTDHLGFVVPPVDSNLSETATAKVSPTTTILSSNMTDAASATNKTPLILGDATLLQNTTTGKLTMQDTSMLKSNDTTTGEKKEGDEDHALEIVGDTSLEVVSNNETSKKSEQPLSLHGPDEEPADANFQPLHKEGEEEEAADANFQPLHKHTETDAPLDDKDSTGSTAPKKKIEGWKEAENEMLEPIYNKEGDKSPDDQDNESVADKGKEAGLDTESAAKENANLDESLAKAS